LEKLAALNKDIPITWSLNENEAALLYSYNGKTYCEDNLAETLCQLRKSIGLYELVVHTNHLAVASSESEGIAAVDQNYCASPVRTAGAGDTFNGAYLAALLGGLESRERLAVGNRAAEFFVRYGYAPNKEELLSKL